jgi:hypothetical protein
MPWQRLQKLALQVIAPRLLFPAQQSLAAPSTEQPCGNQDHSHTKEHVPELLDSSSQVRLPATQN